MGARAAERETKCQHKNPKALLLVLTAADEFEAPLCVITL